MIDPRDTFLHFLSDNLVGPTVHYVNRTADDPTSDAFSLNSVNVEFLNPIFSRNDNRIQVSIDVLNDDEATANTWVVKVWELLSSAFFTRLLDYTNPSSPVDTGKNLSWQYSQIEFRKIVNHSCAHYHCVITLSY